MGGLPLLSPHTPHQHTGLPAILEFHTDLIQILCSRKQGFASEQMPLGCSSSEQAGAGAEGEADGRPERAVRAMLLKTC